MATGIMPNVIGKNFDLAKQAILDEATQSVAIDSVPTPGEPADIVDSQEPEAGEQIGDSATLYVRDGS